MVFNVTVDPQKCKGCEDCLEVCTTRVFEIKEGACVPVRPENCVGCQSCAQICKESAITVVESQPDMSDTLRSLLQDIL